MYKDVGKRIVAFLMLVCMFVTLVEWPTPVFAASGTSYTYQNGDGTNSFVTLDVDTVASVFQTNQTEVLDSVMFDVHVEGGGTAKATISYYMGIKNGQPDSGTRVFEKTVSVREGTNTFHTGLDSQTMNGQSLFAVVISLEGATFYTYGGTGTGQSYVLSDGSWKDMYTAYGGKCAAIRAITYGRQAVGGAPSAGVQTYGDSVAAIAAGDLDTIELEKVNVLVAVGERAEIQLNGVGADNEKDISWRVEEEWIASLETYPTFGNRIAYVHGVTAGTTNVIATYDGKEYTCKVTVTKDFEDSVLTLDPASPVVYNGKLQTPTLTVTIDGEELTQGTEGNYHVGYLRWNDTNSNYDIDVIPGQDGAFINAGLYQVYALTNQDQGYGVARKAIEYEIEPKAITDGSIIVTLADVAPGANPSDWEGALSAAGNDPDQLNEFIKSIEDNQVEDSDPGRHVLELHKDYELELNADKTGIVIKGINNYQGEQTLRTPQSLENAEIRFDEANAQYIYTGTSKQPPFHVLLNGETLSKSDYIVTDWNYPKKTDYNVGKITIEIEGQGPRFYGNQYADYEIIPKDIDNGDVPKGIEVPVEISWTIPTDKDAIADAITLTYNGMTLKKGVDYTVSDLEEVVRDNGITEYYITLTGQGNYTGTRRVGPFTIGDDINNYIDDVQIQGTYTYDGLAKEPYLNIVWKDNNNILSNPDNYVVEFENNINAGTATVRIRGVGDYGGVIIKTFEIQPLDLSDPNVEVKFVDADGTLKSASEFGGLDYSPELAEIKPELSVVFKRTQNGVEETVTVVLGTDYEVEYEVDQREESGNYVMVGDRTATARGIRTITDTGTVGNFTGSRTLTYNIRKFNLGDTSGAITAVLDQEIYNYTGAQIDPLPVMTITHRSRSGNTVYTLNSRTPGLYDYKEPLTYSEQSGAGSGQIDMGTYTVTAYADDDGNYSGSVQRSYTIHAIDIATVVRKSNFVVTSDNEAKDYADDAPYVALLWYDRNVLTNNQLRFEIWVDQDGDGNRETMLVPTVDYEIVSWDGYDHVSSRGNEASVTIRGIGKYFNTVTVKYLLAEDLAEYRVSMTGYVQRTYTGEAVELTKDDISVYDAGTTLSQRELEFGEDYTVSYEDSDGTKGAAINAGLATVYVEARLDVDLPSANGCFRYKDPSDSSYENEEKNGKRKHTFQIGQQDIGMMPPIKYDYFEVDYTGSPLTPTDKIKIHHGSYDLVENKDYTVRGDWANNINPYPVPIACVTVDGTGNYCGELVIVFRIVGKSLSDIVWVTMSPDPVIYNGQPQQPDIVELMLSDGTKITGKENIQSAICTWDGESYEDNRDAGTARLTVSGVGIYTGSTRTFTFEIQPLPFTSAGSVTTEGFIQVTGAQDDYTYQSTQIKPQLTVACTTNGTPVTLDEKSYELRYETNMNVWNNGPSEPYSTSTTDHTAVTLIGTGNYTGEYSVNFVMHPKKLWDPNNEELDPQITIDPIEPQVWNFVSVRPVPRIVYTNDDGEIYILQSGVDFDCEYFNNDGLGVASIKITGKGNFADVEGDSEVTNIIPETYVTFQIGQSLQDSSIRVTYPGLESEEYTSNGGFLYDGYAKEPAVLVEVYQSTDSAGNESWRALQKGVDYTVEYVDPLGSTDGAVNAGTAKIVVKGAGIYAGSIEQEFTILHKNLTDDDIAFSLNVGEDGTMSYTKGAVEPSVTLIYSALNPDVRENRQLLEGLDYSVEYSGAHTEIGTVTVTVTGDGNYVGERNTSFEIVPAEIGTSRYEPNPGFRVGAIPPQPLIEGKAEPVPVLTYNDVPLTPGTDYSWTYENNTSVGTGTVIIKGEGNYSKTIRKDFEIVEGAADINVEVPESVVFKDYITPEVQAKFDSDGELPEDWSGVTLGDEQIIVTNSDGETLAPGVDYTVAYENNDWIGEMKVIITGTGTKMVGVVEKTVKVTMTLPGTDEDVAKEPGLTLEVPPVAFTGSPVNGIPVITYYGRRLTFEHYDVTCYNNVNVGNNTAEIWIVGRNCVNGMYVGNFTIYPNSQVFEVQGVEESYMYTGQQWKPIPENVYYNNVRLVEGTDYTLEYGENINVGTDAGIVFVKGIGNYETLGTSSVHFSILPWEVGNLTITLTPSSATYTGLAMQPEVTLVARINNISYPPMPQSDYKVTYKDNINSGLATVTIEGISGNVTGTVDKTFRISAKSLAVPTPPTTDQIRVVVDPSSVPYDGTEKRPDVYVYYRYGDGATQERTLARDADFTVKYSNNINSGTATIRIDGIGNYSGWREVEFTITEQELTDGQVVVTFKDGLSYPYMGSGVEIRPAMTVTVNGRELTEGKDYTTRYAGNTTVGTATVTIIGNGSFVGQIERQFNITTHDINAADIKIQDIPNQGYTGSGITPEVVITCGTYTLVRGVDYDMVVLGDNINPGEVTIQLHGINGFDGYRNVTFNIASDIGGATIEGFSDSVPFKGSAYTIEELTRNMVVKIGTAGLTVDPSNYTIEFAPGSDGFSAGEQKLILTGIKDYGGTKELPFTITQKDITDNDVRLDGFIENLTGTANHEQVFTLRWGDIKLVEGTDYEVEYQQTAEAGKWIMTVTGQNNYKGTITKEFTMELVGIAAMTITLSSDTFTYDGSEHKPIVTVMDGEKELMLDVEYSVKYENNVNAGMGTVTITGLTPYEGEVTVNFLILGRSIALAEVSPSPIPTQVYTGRDVEPTVKLFDTAIRAAALTEKTDYMLRYENNRKAGVGTVTAVGRGNYLSTNSVSFSIRPYTVATPKIIKTTSNSIEISWTMGGMAMGYEIQRETNGSGNWQQIAVVGSRYTSYTDETVSANTAYAYRVRAYVIEDTNTFYGDWSEPVRGNTAN